MRTRIYRDGPCHVVLEYDDPFSGERLREVYHVPTGGGYVRRADLPGLPQVCERLARTGPTLYVRRADLLLDAIRREWRRAQRLWRRVS